MERSLKRELLAFLFAIFGIVNLILSIFGIIQYIQLQQMAELLNKIYEASKVANIPFDSALSSVEFRLDLLMAIIISSLTAISTSALLIRRKESFRVTGVISSGLFFIYFMYYFVYNIGLSVTPVRYVVLGLFSLVLLSMVILNWSKKIEIE